MATQRRKMSKQKLDDYEIIELPIEKIKPDPTNPNVMSDEKFKALKVGLKKKFSYPVIVDQNHIIIDGFHRWKAWKELGNHSIRVIIQHCETEIERKIWRQVYNKVRGEHDKIRDASEFLAIYNSKRIDNFVQLIGQPKEDFLRVLEQKYNMEFESTETDETPPLPPKAKAKTGEIYQLGKHRIMCGDTASDLIVLLNDKKIDMIWSDPPYGVGYEQGKFTGVKIKKRFEPMQNDEKRGEKLQTWIYEMYKEIKKHSPNAPIYVCSPPMIPSLAILKGLIESGYHMQSQIIWVKDRFILGRADYHWKHEIIWYGYESNPHCWNGGRSLDSVWEIKRDNAIDYNHPTQKPVALSLNAIKNSSNEGDLILDPFLGSGSSLIACEQTGRICYGMEIEPRYIDVIIQRWENYTGKKAVKL